MFSRIASIGAVLGALPTIALAQTKHPVSPSDYGKWESLAPATLSPDGRWLAYGINRVSEENELRLATTVRDTTVVVRYGSAPAFSADSRWLAYAIGIPPAERDRLTRDKKPIRSAAGVRKLATGDTTVFADISSFRFSPDGHFLALRGTPAEGKRAADLVVLTLETGVRTSFGNVSEFAWAESGPLLAITLETEGNKGNAVQVYDASQGTLRVLDASASLYRVPAWRHRAADLAVLRTRVDKGFRDTTHVVLAWTKVTSAAPARRELDPAAPGFPTGMRIAEHRTPEWSKDGAAVFIGLRAREPAPPADPEKANDGNGVHSAADAAKGDPDKPSDVQVWHARDVRIIPQQKSQEQQELKRTLLAAWHPGDGRVVQIGTRLLENTRVLEGAHVATETDASGYAFGAKFGRPFTDVWLVDVATGERRKALDKVRYFLGGSATGKSLLWFDGKDYWRTDVATLARTNLSAKAHGEFANKEFDYPNDFLPPEGEAGWTVGDKSVLVYDELDVWSLAADGSGGRRLTDGAREHVIHRYARTAGDTAGIDPSRPIYLSLFGRRDKKSGYARIVNGAPPERLVYEDASVRRLARADSTDVFAFTTERFDDSPDWFVGSAALRDARQLSHTNPFHGDYAWGKTELVDFTSATGKPLQAVLTYPANYDASRKYPMIVYTYERLSQELHSYYAPSERNYYDVAVWSANGYFVLKPDIVFRDRDPGPSVLEAVEPAVKTVVDRGLVDPKRVGHVGHSWGGYEAAFLPTRTHIFAASVAGAPITNFLSFAGAIHWTPGIAEFDHWETGQARMAVPYWEDMDAYLRSSPAAKINELTTPVLVEVGDADGTVDWHQGIEYYNFARRAGKDDLVMLMYPGEDHGLRKKENQIDYHRRINQWFGHWLKGEPAPKWMTEGVTWMERKAALDAAQPAAR